MNLLNYNISNLPFLLPSPITSADCCLGMVRNGNLPSVFNQTIKCLLNFIIQYQNLCSQSMYEASSFKASYPDLTQFRSSLSLILPPIWEQSPGVQSWSRSGLLMKPVQT